MLLLKLTFCNPEYRFKSKSSEIKRWYTLYHELGHDILNLDHGEGGRMMFNFAPSDYTWQQFFDDRDAMFNSFFKL